MYEAFGVKAFTKTHFYDVIQKASSGKDASVQHHLKITKNKDIELCRRLLRRRGMRSLSITVGASTWHMSMGP
jgi:hypothetical protein